MTNVLSDQKILEFDYNRNGVVDTNDLEQLNLQINSAKDHLKKTENMYQNKRRIGVMLSVFSFTAFLVLVILLLFSSSWSTFARITLTVFTMISFVTSFIGVVLYDTPQIEVAKNALRDLEDSRVLLVSYLATHSKNV